MVLPRFSTGALKNRVLPTPAGALSQGQILRPHHQESSVRPGPDLKPDHPSGHKPLCIIKRLRGCQPVPAGLTVHLPQPVKVRPAAVVPKETAVVAVASPAVLRDLTAAAVLLAVGLQAGVLAEVVAEADVKKHDRAPARQSEFRLPVRSRFGEGRTLRCVTCQSPIRVTMQEGQVRSADGFFPVLK